MAIGLYTSRINLLSLGIENFGVYNVVAGFVVMFSSITGSLSNAISRYLMVELGRGDYNKLRVVFSTAINVQLLFAVIIAFVGESVGIWFLNNKMQIPDESLYAATWVLHFSIIQFAIGLLMVPLNSTIVAHERMGAFAYLSFFDAGFRLAIAYLLFITPFDKLITFGALIMLNQLLTFLLYSIYCVRNFKECHYSISLDKRLIKEISVFAGWNMIPNAAYVLNIHGTNMLMNVFFGVIVNAARGVANQVNNAVNSFITNFMTAVVPQIIKSYASGEKNAAFSITCRATKFSYFLILVLSLPILLETPIILDLWLKTPPEYSVSFVRWQLATTMTMVFGQPLFNLMMADGRVKMYQLINSLFTICPFALSWILFKLGFPVVTGYIICFIIYLTLIPVRLLLVNKIIGLPMSDYLGGVVLRTIIVSMIAIVLPLMLHMTLSEGFSRLVIVGVISIVSSLISIYIFGLTRDEKNFFKSKLIAFKIKMK